MTFDQRRAEIEKTLDEDGRRNLAMTLEKVSSDICAFNCVYHRDAQYLMSLGFKTRRPVTPTAVKAAAFHWTYPFTPLLQKTHIGLPANAPPSFRRNRELP
jgi:hypothetical protein